LRESKSANVHGSFDHKRNPEKEQEGFDSHHE
jgi:hypothetical protein